MLLRNRIVLLLYELVGHGARVFLRNVIEAGVGAGNQLDLDGDRFGHVRTSNVGIGSKPKATARIWRQPSFEPPKVKDLGLVFTAEMPVNSGFGLLAAFEILRGKDQIQNLPFVVFVCRQLTIGLASEQRIRSAIEKRGPFLGCAAGNQKRRLGKFAVRQERNAQNDFYVVAW